MQDLQHPALAGAIEVDQQIPAGREVEVRERRVLDDVVFREEDQLAQLRAYAIAIILFREESLQPLHRDVRGVGHGVDALPRDGDAGGIDIGREYLDPGRIGQRIRVFGEQHGDRIGFLAGRARGHPGAHLIVAALAREQRRNDFLLEGFEGRTIPIEMRDADEDVLQERLQFLRTFAQQLRIGAQLRHAMDRHAPADAPAQRRPLVVGEVMARAGPEMREDLS